MIFRLVLIRHAIAEDREKFHAATGRPDWDRPLTPKGRRRMVRNARGIVRLVPALDLLVSSPLLRARETMEVMKQAYPGVRLAICEPLAPGGRPADVLHWLQQQRKLKDAVGLIGHEPDLSRLARAFLGRASGGLRLKKGGILILEFSGKVSLGGARLEALVPPVLLRKISRR